MAHFKVYLHLFGDGAGAGAAPAAGTGEGGEAAVVQPGQLEDGTVVDNRLAARMEAQAKRRRDRGDATVMQAAQKAAKNAQENATEAEPEKSLDDEWTEAKKGKYREQYARDVKAAIDDRFKNQADANAQLQAMQPMLDALMKKAGAKSVEELQQMILDDDSLYEDEAEQAGMTVEGYKAFKHMQEENARYREQEERDHQEQFLRQHFQYLDQQAQEMKKIYPDFDLRREMENETFRRLVAPNSGLKVSDAYFAVHHSELEPQAMAYGYQRAQQQISNTLQANRARPVEGPLKKGQSADVAIDPRSMSREDRQKLIERVRRGEKIIF